MPLVSHTTQGRGKKGPDATEEGVVQCFFPCKQKEGDDQVKKRRKGRDRGSCRPRPSLRKRRGKPRTTKSFPAQGRVIFEDFGVGLTGPWGVKKEKASDSSKSKVRQTRRGHSDRKRKPTRIEQN